MQGLGEPRPGSQQMSGLSEAYVYSMPSAERHIWMYTAKTERGFLLSCHETFGPP